MIRQDKKIGTFSIPFNKIRNIAEVYLRLWFNSLIKKITIKKQQQTLVKIKLLN